MSAHINSAEPLARQPISPLAAQIAARAQQQRINQQAQSAQPTQSHAPARPPVSLVQMKPQPLAEILSPSTQIVDQDDLNTWDKGLCRAIDGHRNTLVEIAYYGAKIRAANGWEKLGFTDEEAYRQDKGVGEKTWKEYLKLGERLGHIPLAEMAKLSFQSARLLVKVNPTIWPEYAWAQEAALLPPREFSMLVDQRNREAGSQTIVETKVRLSVEVGATQLSKMERRLGALRKQHNLQSTAAAVDYALSAAERERQLSQRVASLESILGDLVNLWQPGAPWSSELAEPDAERDARLKAGAPIGLSDAAAMSQRLVRKVMKSMEGLHAVLPETIDSSSSKPAIDPTSPETA